jgi:hypothetical protein
LLIELTMKVFSLYPLVQTLAMISQLSICGWYYTSNESKLEGTTLFKRSNAILHWVD